MITIKVYYNGSFIDVKIANELIFVYNYAHYHSPASALKPDKIEFDIGEDKDQQEFVGDGDYIDTGCNLFDDVKNWTVLIDFTDGGKSEYINSLFILHNFHEGENLYGFNIQKTGTAQGNRLAFQVNSNFYATKPLVDGVNTRLVIRYTYPNVLELFYDDSDLGEYLGNDKYFKFDYGDVNNTLDNNLYLACWYNEDDGGIGRFWRGMVNEFIIWNDMALSDEMIYYVLANKKEE